MRSIFNFLILLFLSLTSAHTIDLKRGEDLSTPSSLSHSLSNISLHTVDSDGDDSEDIPFKIGDSVGDLHSFPYEINNTGEEDYTLQPIKKSRREMFELDRDFFPAPPQGSLIRVLQGMRVLTSTTIGLLVSMPVTSQVMILVGDWVGALHGTTAAEFLAIYVAVKSTILFANICDNWFKDVAEFLWPIYVECSGEDEETAEAAFRGKFPTTVADRSYKYYTTLYLLAMSGGTYGFAPLWQVLWSQEQRQFPRLSYFTLPPFYLLTAYMFYKAAKQNLNHIPSTHEAEKHKEILIESVRKYQNKARENSEFRKHVLNRIAKAKQVTENSPLIDPIAPSAGSGTGLNGENVLSPNASPVTEQPQTINAFKTEGCNEINNTVSLEDENLFLFSLLFLVDKNAEHQSSKAKRMKLTQKYIEEINNPHNVHTKHLIRSWIDGFLGVSWVTWSSLQQKSFQATLLKLNILPLYAYPASLTIATLQAASFINATSGIYHSRGQSFASTFLMSEKDDEDESCSSCCKGTYKKFLNFCKVSVKCSPGWLGSKLQSISNYGSSTLLCLADLKRGIEAYASYAYPEKVLGAGLPFFLKTIFLKSIFEENTGNLYRRIVTNLPSRCLSWSGYCRETYERETAEMYGDDAINLIENLNEPTRDMLVYTILQQQGVEII